MKPDSGRARDKQRLADKKGKKAAAKAQRRESLAPVSPRDAAEYAEQLKSRRGSNRRNAFKTWLALDAEAAVAAVVELCRSADGKNLAELGALLASTGLARFTDQAAAGRFGDVAVWEHAPAAAVREALQRLLAQVSRIEIDDVLRRARALGAVPLRDAARAEPTTPLLLKALVDDARWSGVPPDLQTALHEALLELDPPALWVRAEHQAAGPPWRALAALAAGISDDHGLLDAALAWLETLTAVQRSAWLRRVRLPAAALRLPVAWCAPLLRLVLLDEHADAGQLAQAAQGLLACGTDDARATILVRPLADVSVTVQVCERLDLDEAWAVIGPHFATQRALRDAFLSSRHSRDPSLLDAVVRLLVDDPVGAVAFLARSSSPRAPLEAERAFEVCSLDDAGPMLMAAMAPTSVVRLRNATTPLHTAWSLAARGKAAAGPREPVIEAALRSLSGRLP